MANKFFAMVAVASVGCLAFAAPENWFNGGLGSSTAAVSGGAWQNASQTGVTAENYKYVLDEPENPLAFAATDAKLPEGTNLTFTTTANFKYSYDELPAVDDDAKAGVVVYTNRFYVLGKDGNNPSNVWKKTTIDAGTVDGEISVAVVVTNGNSKVFATYTIGTPGVAFNTEVYVKNDAKSWNTVSYKGCGVVASLLGQYEQLGYPIPGGGGGDPIPADRAEAWAEAQGVSKADLAALLASSTTYNGRTAAECCLIGILTNDTGSAAIADTKSDKLQLSVNCNPDANRVEFKINDGSAQKSKDIECALKDGTYKVYAKVDSGSWTQISQEIGVKGTEVTATKVSYIGAPWAECPVTNLLKKTCCSEGDKLEVLNPATLTYSTWELGSDGKWGYVQSKGESEPPLTLKKGQAVKYTAAGNGTLYAVGDVSTETKTDITAGADKWNLIAKPNGDTSAASLPLDSTQAQAIVLNDAGTAPARLFRKVNKKLYTKEDYSKSWVETNDVSITGGFFLKTSSTTSVNW